MYYKKILNLAIPAMGEQVLQLLMGAVDSYLVAQVGLAAVSGVAVANNIMSVYQAIFIGLATAISSLVASHKDKEQEIFLGQGLALTLVFGLGLGLVAICGASPIFSALGLTGAAKGSAVTHFMVLGGSSVLLGLMTTLSSLLRVRGRPTYPLMISLVTNGLNLLISAAFLYLTPLGLLGVSLGTALARFIGSGLLYVSVLPKPRLRQPFFKTSDLLKLFIPLLAERLMMRLGDVVLVSLVVGLGVHVVAGQAIGETLIQFSFLPALALASSTVILVAQMGHDPGVLRRLVRESYMLALALMVLISLLLLGFGDQWLSFFTEQAEVQAYAKILLVVAVFDSPVTAGTQILTATWQGLGRPKLPFYATTLGMWLVRVLGGYLLAIRFGMGLWGVCMAISLDNLSRTVFLYYKLP